MSAKLKRTLLILACGRSGTLFTSKLFKKAGYDLRHEAIGEFGGCSMYMVPKQTDCSIVNNHQKTKIHEGENRKDFQFKFVWHQVRHPLTSIDSLAKSFTRKVRLWTADQLGVPLPGRTKELQCSAEDKLHWAMHYWLINNLRSETQASWTYKLEDFPWKEMLSRLKLPDAPLPIVSRETNRGLRYAFKTKEQLQEIKRTLYDTDWRRLERIDRKLADRIREAARRYGYRV